MDFSRIFLGYREINDFIHLSMRENFITSYHDYFDTGDFNEIRHTHHQSRIRNKSSLLRMLLLYENIDSNRLTTFDLSKLVNAGIIAEESLLNKHGIVDSKDSNFIASEYIVSRKLELEDSKDLRFESFLKGLFFEIDKKFGIYSFDEIVDDFFLDAAKSFSFHNIKKVRYLITQYNIIDILAEEILESIFERTCTERFRVYLDCSFEELTVISKKHAETIVEQYIIRPCELKMQTYGIYSKDKEIENYMNIVDSHYTVDNKKICSKCNYRNSLKCLGEFECQYSLERYVTLLDMHTSSSFGYPIYSTHLQPQLKKSNTNMKIIDDVYYLMKLPALNQLNSLPTPQSIEEALRLRNRPEIASFRKVFNTWCEALQHHTEIDTIELITKDFTMASRALEKQYKANQNAASTRYVIKQNLFSILIQIPGFFIPLFSLIFDLPTPWINRKDALLRQQSEWFLLTR